MTTLGETGEHKTIERLVDMLTGSPDVIRGAGDDCAIVKTSGDSRLEWLFTSDPVISGTHFAPDSDPEAVGRKAVGRVLSDIAAMGGTPRFILIDIAAPGNVKSSYLQRAYKGADRIASEFECVIVGGDLSRADSLQIHVFCAGTITAGQGILRSGARPGQALLVTGQLGGASAGKHLSFTPRIKEGAWLREKGYAQSMIDVSDGLARDATHLAEESGVRINITASKLPLSKHLQPGSAVERALYDGEDFELLFTTEHENLPSILKEWSEQFDTPLTHIGEVSSGKAEVLLDNQIIKLSEFRHF